MIPESYLASLFQTVKPKHAMLLQLDANGEYVSSLHDVGGTTIADISQVVDDGKFMIILSDLLCAFHLGLNPPKCDIHAHYHNMFR